MPHAPADLGPIKPRALDFDLDDMPCYWMASLAGVDGLPATRCT